MQGCELSVQRGKDGHRLAQRGHDVLQPAEVLAAQQRQCVRKLCEHARRARARTRTRSGPREQVEARLELSGGSQHALAASMLRTPALRDAQRLGEQLLPVRGRLHPAPRRGPGVGARPSGWAAREQSRGCAKGVETRGDAGVMRVALALASSVGLARDCARSGAREEGRTRPEGRAPARCTNQEPEPRRKAANKQTRKGAKAYHRHGGSREQANSHVSRGQRYQLKITAS